MSKQERARLLVAEVEYFTILSGYSKKQLALKLGMALSTLYSKLSNPDKFTWREILELFDIMSLSNEKQLQLMSKKK